MKKILLTTALASVVLMSSGCSRVEPNYAGVLMENFGKNGKEDFSLQQGLVFTANPSTKLYQVPLFEQRENMPPVSLKASDNTAFSSQPVYTFKVIPENAVDVVFNNKQITSKDDNFIKSLADNILEPKVLDLMKEESRRYSTKDLMKDGGSLAFEKRVEDLVAAEFKKRGLELLNFSAQLEFSKQVTATIDTRNKVDANVGVIRQQIEEEKQKLELQRIKAETNRVRSEGITDQILKEQFIEKWDGKTPLYGDISNIISNHSGTAK